MNDIELSQKRIEYFNRIIAGYNAIQEYFDFELSRLQPDEPEKREFIDHFLEGKKAISRPLNHYQELKKNHELYLESCHVDYILPNKYLTLPQTSPKKKTLLKQLFSIFRKPTKKI